MVPCASASLLFIDQSDSLGGASPRKLRQRELILSERRVRVDREAMRRLWGCPIC
jgi:hypothetical protein